MTNELQIYASLLTDIKARIHLGHVTISNAITNELTQMYWDIGCLIHQRQKDEGWGSGIIPRLAKDITNELPEIKGFSERNLKRMLRFYREYHSSTNQLPTTIAKLPWGHNALLIEQVKDNTARLWYAEQTIQQGWSRDTLSLMIKNHTFERQGNAITNFDKRLPSADSQTAQQILKDPYVFDFLTLSEQFRERELETELLKHLEKFLIELGEGFSFVGRQYHVEVSDQDFYIDLLFYHLKLRSFIVIELKKGEFKPEYAGKMNFYCSIIDDKLKHPTDNQTIGLILCQNKNKVLAEYALRGMQQPIGVSDYELTKALPEDLQSSLPTIEALEQELTNEIENGDGFK